MGADIERVASWFRRPGEANLSPFRLERTVEVATSITNNCFPRNQINPQVKTEEDLILVGDFLDSFVEIFQNLLRNAVEHSGLVSRPPNVTIEISLISGNLTLRVENDLSENIAAPDAAFRAKQKFESRLTDPSRVYREGGSGIIKIARNIEAELQRPTNIVIDSDTSKNTFIVIITISSAENFLASLSD